MPLTVPPSCAEPTRGFRPVLITAAETMAGARTVMVLRDANRVARDGTLNAFKDPRFVEAVPGGGISSSPGS